MALPQLSSCGPIEASVGLLSGFLPTIAFRNYQVAAPLKPKSTRLLSFALDPFRNYQVAAPLKLFISGKIVFDGAPSATIKLRPH